MQFIKISTKQGVSLNFKVKKQKKLDLKVFIFIHKDSL